MVIKKKSQHAYYEEYDLLYIPMHPHVYFIIIFT